MVKDSRFRGLFEENHVKLAQALLQVPSQQLYHTY